MTEKSVIRDRLWNSVEMNHYKTNLVIFTIFIPCFCAFAALRSGGEYAWPVSGIIMAAFLIPIYVFHGWRIFQIFRAPEEYIFCRCKLTQFHYNYFVRSNYFTVVLDVPEFGNQVVNTRAIFQTRGLVGPLTEDYVSREVTIGYNRFTQTVVVIG